MDSVIELGGNALDFIKQQGGVVTIRLSPKHGCCGGLANIAVAEANEPLDASRYQHYHYQGQGLRVEIEGFWKLRHLYVDGLPPAIGLHE